MFDWCCGCRLVIEIGGSFGLGLVWMEVVVASSVCGLFLLPVSSFYKTLTFRSSFICFLFLFYFFFWLVK